MFTRLCSNSHAGLTLDITVTKINGLLNEHSKVHLFFLSAFFAVQKSDDFVFLTAFRTAGTHRSLPTDSVETLTDLTRSQQRNKFWDKLSTCKCNIRLIYSYTQ